jgi:hypothetical protein
MLPLRGDTLCGIADVMTNYDGTIDEDVASQLQGCGRYAYYPAMNFHGTVWWDIPGWQWACEIRQCGVHVTTLVGATLEDIMRQACDQWGSA